MGRCRSAPKRVDSGKRCEPYLAAKHVTKYTECVIQKEKKPPVKLLLKPPVSLTSNTSGTSSSAGTESPKLGSTAELDSVLLDAISDPRERMIVFQIENNILNFMNSK
jgi:hypothetical protein